MQDTEEFTAIQREGSDISNYKMLTISEPESRVALQ